VPLITEQQKKWYFQEFESFSFKGDLVWCELSTDGPLPTFNDERDVPMPGYVLHVTQVDVNGDNPNALAIVCLDGAKADDHYSKAEKEELIKLLEEKIIDDGIAWMERHENDA
jgi:hypothetical protein